jgi:uncharacterized membrane protein
MLLYIAIYAFFGLATSIATSTIREFKSWQDVVGCALIGCLWPLLIATRLILKMVD